MKHTILSGYFNSLELSQEQEDTIILLFLQVLPFRIFATILGKGHGCHTRASGDLCFFSLVERNIKPRCQITIFNYSRLFIYFSYLFRSILFYSVFIFNCNIKSAVISILLLYIAAYETNTKSNFWN